MKSGGEKVHTCNDIKDAALKARCESAFDACADLSQEDGSRATCEYRATSCIDNYLRGAPDYRIEMSRNNPLIYSTPGSCLGASVRVTKNLGPLARFAEAAGADKPEPGAGTRAQASRRKSETKTETLPPEYEVCEKTGSRGSPKNDLCRERVGICLSDGPYGIPIGSSKINYADRPACLRGVARLTRADSGIKPASPTVPQEMPAPPTVVLPPRPSDSPPMGERASALDDIFKKLIREIDASPNYVRRINAVMDRMRRRGVDVKSMGPVHPASSLIGGGTLAMVIAIGNDLFVGQAGGLSDFLLELLIAHEHRHRVQNESVWNDLVTKAGLDPNRCPLHKAFSGEGVPHDYKVVYEKYLDVITGPSSFRGPFKELDAYIYMHDYYTKYLAPEINQTQYFIFNTLLRNHIQNYLDAINGEYGMNMTAPEWETYRTASDLRNELGTRLNDFRDENWARGFERDLERYLKQVYEKYSGTLEYPDGEDYSLRERLLVLPGAGNEVRTIKYLAEDAASLGGIEGLRLRHLSEDAAEKENDLDSLLNRQTLGYAFQLRDNTQHAVEYRNDTSHSSDGFTRAQWFIEGDFGGKGEIKEDFRLGQGGGIYHHLTDNIFLKIALSFYAGYQTGIENPILGLRLDALQLHWDIPFTQRFGISLFAGYSLGMHLGWNDSDAYDEARVGAEVFNF